MILQSTISNVEYKILNLEYRINFVCPCPRCYEQDLGLAKDLQDKLAQAKAYCNLGLAHKALGEYSKAEECQRYLLSLAQALDNTQVPQGKGSSCGRMDGWNGAMFE